MLYALGQPISFAGLLVGFVLSLAVRAVAQRAVLRALRLNRFGARRGFSLRHDVDPFGAVVAAIGGAGWGRPLDVDEVPRTRGRLAAAAVFAAGPVATLILAVILLGAFAAVYGDAQMLHLNLPSIGLLGVYGEDPGAQFLLSLAVAPLGFALFTLVPIPPLDGFGLLWCCFRRPGPGIAKYKHWFADNNIGVAVLLVVLIVPFLRAPFFIVIDLAAAPLMRAWT